MFELLLLPLQLLIGLLGAGGTAAGPSALRTGAQQLETVGSHATTDRTTQTTDAAGAAIGALNTSGAQTVSHGDAVAARGQEIAAIIDAATHLITQRQGQAKGVEESFIKAATSAAHAGIPGLVSLIPVAIQHFSRAMEIVDAGRTDLEPLTQQLRAIEAQQQTGDDTTATTVPSAATSTDPSLAITLPDGTVVHAPNERAATAVRAALTQLGVPYVWGGTTPGQGLDCSGLTQWAYRQAGLEIPRLANEQDSIGYQVSQSDLQPGDLAVWSGHVAMYVGDGRMIEAICVLGSTTGRTRRLQAGTTSLGCGAIVSKRKCGEAAPNVSAASPPCELTSHVETGGRLFCPVLSALVPVTELSLQRGGPRGHLIPQL